MLLEFTKIVWVKQESILTYTGFVADHLHSFMLAMFTSGDSVTDNSPTSCAEENVKTGSKNTQLIFRYSY